MSRIRESQLPSAPVVAPPGRRRRAVALGAAAVAAVAGLVAVGPTAPAEAKGPTSFTVVGSGWGHGRGLSQYGAQNAARNLGRTSTQILDNYYPRTASTRVGGRMAVLLTRDTTDDVVVGHRTGLRARSLATGRIYKLTRSKATRWRLVGLDAKRTRLQVALRGTRGWTTLGTIRGQAEFYASGPVRLFLPDGSSADYRGRLRSAVPPGGRGRDTVNIVRIDDYLRGVVPAEVPALWHPQAVRAQAVAARTYAAFERDAYSRRAYHLCDTSACQVYRGVAAEHPATDAAVAATSGVIRTYGGKPIFAQFSSSSGGWSVKGTQPYLVAKADPWDTWSGNPNASWRVTVTAAAIEVRWPAVGDVADVVVTGDAAAGNRAVSVRLVPTAGTGRAVTVSADDFRRAFGLRSTMFRRG